MTTPLKRATILAIILATIAIFLSSRAASQSASADIPQTAPTITKTIPKLDPALEHRRETWLSALEWCESRGVNSAINPEDLDGTPSYYSFQFKPSTFKHFSTKYGLLPKDLEDADYFNHMSDYSLMRNVVRHMIDDPEVVWEKQFPDCVKRKVGRPPIK